MAVAPAAAVTNVAYSFDTSNSNLTLQTSTSLGNSLSFTSQAGANPSLTMTAKAWNATIDTTQYLVDNNRYITVNGRQVSNPNYGRATIPNPTYGQYVITKASVAEYAGGLAVTSKYDDLGGTTATRNCGVAQCDTHQIDNFGNSAGSSSIDFIELDFSQAVTLGQVQQSAFESFNKTLTSQNINDDDMSYGKGTKTTFSDGLAMTTSAFGGVLTSNIGNNGECSTSTWKNDGVTLTGCNDTKTLNTSSASNSTTASTTWFIAASILSNYGGDGNPDSFKIASLTAYYTLPPVKQAAVPEPSTWMTMILGFGVAGTALRRARRQKAAALAA